VGNIYMYNRICMYLFEHFRIRILHFYKDMQKEKRLIFRLIEIKNILTMYYKLRIKLVINFTLHYSEGGLLLHLLK